MGNCRKSIQRVHFLNETGNGLMVILINMTFWAIDKLKSLKSMSNNLGITQNVLNIGSKLTSYIVSREHV